MIKVVLLLAVAAFVVAGCGGHHKTAPKPIPHRVTEVAWYLRGQISVTADSQVRWTTRLAKLDCKASAHKTVTCFIQFYDNSCGTGVFHITKDGLVLGHISQWKMCDPVRPSS